MMLPEKAAGIGAEKENSSDQKMIAVSLSHPHIFVQ
jgi:hypothetical protein